MADAEVGGLGADEVPIVVNAQNTRDRGGVKAPIVADAEKQGSRYCDGASLGMRRMAQMWWISGVVVMAAETAGGAAAVAMGVLSLSPLLMLGAVGSWIGSLFFGFVLGIYPFGILNSLICTVRLGVAVVAVPLSIYVLIVTLSGS